MILRRPAPSGATLARAVGAAFVVALLIGGPASTFAASAAPSPQPADANIEAWLDEPFTPDAAVGATIPNGITVWDRAHGDLLELSDAYVVLHPAKGSAKPTETRARSDWPGHLGFEITIPKGGPGRIEVGFEGQTCTADGTCAETRFPFAFGGTGPPPDAPRNRLVTTSLLSPQSPVLAGETLDVVVDITPKAAWALSDLGLPDRIIAIATTGGTGPDLATTQLRATGDPRPEPGMSYTGQMTIPEPGAVRLLIAIPGNGTEDEVLGSPTRLTVNGDGSEASPSARPVVGNAPTGPTTPATEPPWLLLLGGAGIVAAGLVIRKAFADL